ncbi:MAG: CHAT domain-containing protein [Acidimicrobiales bacterium]
MQLGEVRKARLQVSAGLALATAPGLARQRAELVATSALLWFHAEQPDLALAELETAVGALCEDGAPEAAVALYGQRALLCFRLGRYDEGLADSDRALGALSRCSAGTGDTMEARVLSNRALAHVYRSDFEAALADFARALELHQRAGAELLVAQVLHNLGFVATRLGDVPLALRRFDQALEAYVRLGLPTHQLMVDRCELLTMARLIPEARKAAAEAAHALETAGLTSDAAEARLWLAEACMADFDLPAATDAAMQAAVAFERQGRAAWVVLARDVKERARRLAIDDPLAVYESARVSAEALEGAGWSLGALDARVSAARCALALGRHEHALAALGPAVGAVAGGPDPSAADAGGPAAGGSSAEQVLRFHAEALGHLARGYPRKSLEALLRGLEAASAHASDLRVSTGQAGHGSPVAALAETGLGIALSEGDPAGVLEWAERWRFGIRSTWAEPDAGADGSRSEFSSEALLEALGESVLIEFISHNGELLALIACRGELRLSRIGPLEPVLSARSALHFAIGQLVSGRQGESRRRAMAALLKRSVATLDARVIGTLLHAGRAEDLSREQIVIVPSGGLHDLPYGALPSLSGLPVTLAPSAAIWAGTAGMDTGLRDGLATDDLLLVAGPDLRAAGAEAEAIRSVCYAGKRVRVLEGPGATRAGVLEGLSRAAVAHLAVHGRFRADNPYMSTFHLYDGDLTIHEMTSGNGRQSPSCVVLSACDAGRIVAQPGEELTGPVPALLGFGAGFAIAAVAPLVDSAMPEVSVALHSRLAAGASPPLALRDARLEIGELSSLDLEQLAEGGDRVMAILSAACLGCHGPGSRPPGITPLILGESST